LKWALAKQRWKGSQNQLSIRLLAMPKKIAKSRELERKLIIKCHFISDHFIAQLGIVDFLISSNKVALYRLN
jgi:hypothetical protein